MKDGGFGFFCIYFACCLKHGNLGTGRKILSHLHVLSKQAIGHISLDSLEILLATHTLTVSHTYKDIMHHSLMEPSLSFS